MEERNDPFWTDDISILYNQDRMIEFLPSEDMSHTEKLNAITRFFLYAGILLTIQQKNLNPLYLAVFGMASTYFIYKNAKLSKGNGKDKKSKDTLVKSKKVTFADGINRDLVDIDGNPYEFTEGKLDPILIKKQLNELGETEECAMPTPDNPFMNFQQAGDDPRRFNIPPCQYEDTIDQDGVKQQVEDYFDDKLYKDVGVDIYERNNSQREFYTVPTHDQSSFANWLYNSPPTCKEDNEMCLDYEDIRAKRPIYPVPEENPISTKRYEQLAEL